MIADARRFSDNSETTIGPFRLGVTSGMRRLPVWKNEADFLLAQVTFSIEELLEWRTSLREFQTHLESEFGEATSVTYGESAKINLSGG